MTEEVSERHRDVARSTPPQPLGVEEPLEESDKQPEDLDLGGAVRYPATGNPSTGDDIDRGQELSAAKVSALKRLIDAHLRKNNVYDSIRTFVSEFSASGSADGPQDVLDSLREKHVITEVLRSLEAHAGREGATGAGTGVGVGAGVGVERARVRGGEQYLLVKVVGARGFAQTFAGTAGRFVVRLHYGDQRFESAPVACAAEPQFDATFLVRLSTRFALGSASAPAAATREAQMQGLRRLLRQGHDRAAEEEEEEGNGNARRDGPHSKAEGEGEEAEEWKRLRHQLHIVVLRVDDNGDHDGYGGGGDGYGGPRELVATHLLEWRRLLSSSQGGASVALELTGQGGATKMKTTAGTLDLRLDLVPSVSSSTSTSTSGTGSGTGTGTGTGTVGARLGVDEVDGALRAEKRAASAGSRAFCEYAAVWWREFAEANATFRGRLVKIFAENEWGEHQPASTFLWPMRGTCTARLLDTPRHAARFVSLLPYAREEAVGGGRTEVWHSPHTFLAKGQGDCEDHALLLCSLLLGFGLDAYVCVGTVEDRQGAPERDHVWVATLAGKNRRECVFWESLTGQRIPHRQRLGNGNGNGNGNGSKGFGTLKSYEDEGDEGVNAYAYVRVGCVFNHEGFWANKQLDDRVRRCSFNVRDELKWKAMDERLLAPLRRCAPVPLRAPTLDARTEAARIEAALRVLVAAERREQHGGLSTQWDARLSHYLTPALSAYETERCTGVVFGNEEFQAVIKRHIPRGHSFKAYPTMFNHRDPQGIMHSLRLSDVAADIVGARADHAHFALSVKVCPFPENVAAVWVMLAVRFRAS